MSDFEKTDEETMAVDAPPEAPSAINVDDALTLAASMKESGNDLFKSGDVDGARGSYEAALDAIKACSEDDQQAENVKDVLIALYGNVCMCRVKKEEWKESIEAASEVLSRQADNVKSLYRRGLSYNKLKSYDKAIKDLKACLKSEPANAAAKKELQLVERALAAAEKKSAADMKAAFAGKFGSNGSGLYDDREKERAAKKRREEDEENRLRDEWTKDKLNKRITGEPEQTFEEYKADLKKQKEEERKEKEKEQKAKEKSGRSTSSSSSSPPKVSSAKKTAKKKDSDDDSSDDEDLKGLVKGYKLTSDGKKTSFFNNEMDDKTKELIGDFTPQALGTGTTAGGGDNPQPLPTATATGTGTSAWNHAGTFESRDMTEWAKTHLKALLGGASSALSSDATGNPPSLFGGITIETKECKDVKGEAEIVMTRGKKKAIYDMSADLTFEMNMDTTSATLSEKKYKGKVSLTDITGDDEPEVAFSYKKAPNPEHKGRADEAVKGLVEVVKKLCEQFKVDLLGQ